MLERDEAGEMRYALRVSADVLGSDGSSSMASVCAGSLALMGCGAPIREAVAGVAMGLISDDAAESAEEPRDLILTDILGAEDRFGDLDMKVSGPRDGVTAYEMDTKRADGIAVHTIERVLYRARDARATILDAMKQCGLDGKRELPTHAPRVSAVPVRGEQVRGLMRDRGVCRAECAAKACAVT